jgi:hypothetical protein
MNENQKSFPAVFSEQMAIGPVLAVGGSVV